MSTATKEAEIALIGEILSNPEIFNDANLELMVADFEVSECQRIYSACLLLFMENKPIDAIGILHTLQKNQQADMKVFIAQVTTQTVTTRNYRNHIEIVRDAARLRRATAKAQELSEALEYNGNLDYCRKVAADVMRTFDGMDGTEVITAADGYRNFIDNIGEVKKYIGTGVEKLNHYVQISKGDFIVIGGRPSTGKTAFTLQMMLTMAKEANVVYFSLETSADKLFERMISNFTMSSYTAIRKGGMEQNEINTIKELCEGSFDNLNFSVVNAAGWSVEKIKSKALQLKADVIFIDYLGLITANSGKSQYEKVTQISLDLHTMAQQSKIAVISLVQLNRAGVGQPDMSSLRDSGQIEQDADVIMILNTPNEDEEHNYIKKLRIVKNKDGLVGTLTFEFVGDYQQFRVIDTDNE